MARPSELKRLWKKYKGYWATKKQRAHQAGLESSSRHSREDMVLEEAAIIVVGLGLEMRQEEGECIEDFVIEDDPRFINNPHGIGCSRTYEIPYDSATDSLSTSPVSTCALVPRESNPNESDQQPSSSFNVWAWNPVSIDMEKGKRKGRMPGDSAEDRYKYLLDGSAARRKSSAKRFTLVRPRAWTR